MKKEGKNKYIIIFASIFFILISFLYFSNKFDLSDSRYNTKKYNIKNNIVKNIELNSNLEYIYLHIDKKEIDSNDHAYYNFNVLDKNNKIVYSDYISFKEFILANEYKIDFRKLNIKKGKYNFIIKTDKNIENFKIDFKYKNTSKLYIFYLCFFILSFIMLLLFLFRINKKEQIHIVFLKLAIPIFLLYIIAIPILAGHDEIFQWTRSYEISLGKFIPEVNYSYSGSWLPEKLDLGLSLYADNLYEDVFSTISRKVSNKYEFLTDLSIGVYCPIQFIPQAIGIRIARLFTNRLLIMAYAGRIFNALVCLMLLTLAIKIIPIGKKICTLLFLSPMAIEIFTTLSGDGLTICFSILLISIILKLKNQNDKINNKDIVVISICSCLLALCKIIYILIPFLILLIPKSKYKNKKQFKIMIIFCLILPIIFNIIWLILAMGISEGAAVFSIPSKNLVMLLIKPFDFIKIMIYSIEYHGRRVILEFLSGDLLMSNALKNSTLIPSLLLFSIIYFIKEQENEKMKFNKKDIFIIIIISILLVIALLASEYVFFNRFNTRIIEGFQGRHFLPFVPIILLTLNKLYGKEKRKNSTSFLITVIIIVNYVCLCNLLATYL